MRRFTAGLLAVLATAWASAGPAFAEPADEALAAHRAVYALSLGDLRTTSAVADAAGRFEFEWSDVCDGWAVNQRFRLALLYEDDMSVSFGWSLSSWESKGGRQYRFFIRRFDSSGEVERVRGEAMLDDDGSGRAVFQEPEPREVALPPGTLFPTAHTLHVLTEARRGAAPVWTEVFDGSGEGAPFGISAVLSRALSPAEPAKIDSPLLDGMPSWRVSLAYYDPEADALEPEQEQDLRLFANGVVDEMRLDYGDFVLDAALAELEPLPRPDC